MTIEINKNPEMAVGDDREINVAELEAISGGSGVTAASVQKADVKDKFYELHKDATESAKF